MTVRAPDFETDGWCLEDGEARHTANPERFLIPPADVREALLPGDFAQLIFRIALAPEDAAEEGQDDATERMWVVVRERIEGGYIGVLDNTPDSIAENDKLWLGIDLPFEPRHVIDADLGNDESAAIAASPPKRPWR